MSEWANRLDFDVESLYHNHEGLALWQAGHELSSIGNWLAAARVQRGSAGDVTPISKGLDRAARFIEIDRRPAVRRRKFGRRR